MNFDRVADIYDATRSLPAEEMNSIIDSMTDVLKECKTIIDAGIGTGRFAVPLSQRGFSVVGLDISQKMIAVARQKGLGDLLLGDAEGKIPFKDNSFDAALVVHVLHLIGDWKSVVHELARVSRAYVVTVFTQVEGINPRDRYAAMRRELGVSSNISEQSWKSALSKAKIFNAYDQFEEIDGDESIVYLQNRGSSVTWEVPDTIHEKIMTHLKSELQGKRFRRRAITNIVVWESKRLRSI